MLIMCMVPAAQYGYRRLNLAMKMRKVHFHHAVQQEWVPETMEKACVTRMSTLGGQQQRE